MPKYVDYLAILNTSIAGYISSLCVKLSVAAPAIMTALLHHCAVSMSCASSTMNTVLCPLHVWCYDAHEHGTAVVSRYVVLTCHVSCWNFARAPLCGKRVSCIVWHHCHASFTSLSCLALFILRMFVPMIGVA